ncbi:MAG TPA: efflux RND transporter permease subunit [Planctomycetaceae bacterium]|jgi:cobalt-zinc-cadmium resistance protein CzcA|nr:efflux RND transporter permease subunit [Planctomycetaceae bacterium]
MVRRLIEWALSNPLVVLVLAAALSIVGIYSFLNVNVEAYPDPAPAIVEVFAQFPGASAEEVERQVTIPLEVTFFGMPGLKAVRSKSLYGLSDLKMSWNYGKRYTYEAARQEVINRLATLSQPLPTGVTPAISPESPTGEIYRFVLHCPKDASGHDVYTLNDLKSLQDWTLEREFRAVPRIVDVCGWGGTLKRYEIQPDPARLRHFGVTLGQLQTAIGNGNANVGGDYVNQGEVALTVRSIGLLGGGADPVTKVLGLGDPVAAAKILRAEEQRRIADIRALVIGSVNNQPVRVEDIVDGGRASQGDLGTRGVTVGHQTRLGRIGYWKPDRERRSRSTQTLAEVGHDEPDVVECIVLMRKNEETLPALRDVKARVAELNSQDRGRLLPGVKIDTYYDRSDLMAITTETVRENLILGMTLVTFILLLFLSNVRSALIVAINIPLALLFAFSALFLRGMSANLLSIGAVDFGIIVDSSVIMVENIYRHISSGEYAELTLKQRILKATHEVERGLFFTTAIMVCAFLPLFTMQGPEGQIFGPMADTYAFALAGALLLALTVAPVLCLLSFKNLGPAHDNFLVRNAKRSYLRNLKFFLEHRFLTVGVMSALLLGTVLMLPQLGREFMPALEEGNIWIRGTAPLNTSLERHTQISKEARAIIATYPEVESIVNQLGRPDDATDTDGYYNSEYFVPLRPERDWPLLIKNSGWRYWVFGPARARTKEELVAAMNTELDSRLPGISWNFSQNIRDNVMEALSGIKGDNSVKIIGPDLDRLEVLAAKTKEALQEVRGIENVGVFHIRGQSHLEFRVDPIKCQRWGVIASDVNNVIASALGGQALSKMVEGEKRFDIAVRWPKRLRSSETSILDIPVDVLNNTVIQRQGPNAVPSATGSGQAAPPSAGTIADTSANFTAPKLRLRDLVSPAGEDGSVDPEGQYERPGASMIYRERGRRLIAIKFSVRGRDLAGAVAEAQARTIPIIEAPYRAEWSGEFEEMEDAEQRLLLMVPLSLALIFMLLYAAFRNVLDALMVFSNVLALSMGGVWALLLTGTNFNISAAVGFISIFGVAIMDGLLLISYFNRLRTAGVSLEDAILQGAEKRVRPMMMTALTAIFGLLPAALSTKIGSQTQRPLAIVVVGGMIATLALNRYLMPILYSFYGHRDPPASGGSMAH